MRKFSVILLALIIGGVIIGCSTDDSAATDSRVFEYYTRYGWYDLDDFNLSRNAYTYEGTYDFSGICAIIRANIIQEQQQYYIDQVNKLAVNWYTSDKFSNGYTIAVLRTR
jgi:hypothetical protein